MVTWILFISFAIASPKMSIEMGTQRVMLGQTFALDLVLTDISPLEPPTVLVEDGLTIKRLNQAPTRHYEPYVGGVHSVLTYRYHVTALKLGTWRLGPIKPKGVSVSIDDISTFVSVSPMDHSAAIMSQARSSLSAPSPYAGQIVFYNLHFQNDAASSASTYIAPTVIGMHALADIQSKEQRYTLIDGDSEIKVLDVNIPMFASDPGGYAIGASSVVLNLATTSQSLLMSSRVKSYEASALSGRIRPLPEPPADFSGLVGDFTLQLEPSRLSLNQTETLSLSLYIRGNGNLKGYRYPLKLSGFKVYAESPKLTHQWRGNDIDANLVQTWALAPSASGEMILPPVQLVVFNPELEQYERLSTPPLRIIVEASEHLSEEELVTIIDSEPPSVNNSTKKIENPLVRILLFSVLGVVTCIVAFMLRKQHSNSASIPFPIALNPDPKKAAGELLMAMRQKLAENRGMEADELTQKDFSSVSVEWGQLYFDLTRVRYGNGRLEDCHGRLKRIWNRL